MTVSLSSLPVTNRIWIQCLAFLIASLAQFAPAQTLTDLGAANPTPGLNDISQLSTNGNQRLTGSFNYFTDNSAPPGQTFTTGPTPLALASVTIKTGALPLDSGGGGLGPEAYGLQLFFVSGNIAAPINSFTSSSSFSYTDGDWLQWSNLAVPLLTNAVYAYTFRRITSGFDGMAVSSSNYYGGGEAVLIPNAGGVVTYEGSHDFDAVFDVGLASSSQLLAGAPVVLPELTNYMGSIITLRSPALGTPPLYYQWQMGAPGAAMTNIPNATNSILLSTPSGTGTIRYDFIVTNSSGSVTSSVANVIVLAPVAVTINVSNTMAAMPPAGLGVCTAVYDNVLINSSIPPLLKAAGITAVRYSGGSYADIFNWANSTVNDGGYINASDTFHNFMNDVVNPAGAQAIITANYGSNPAGNAGDDPNNAAAWVGDANVTNHWGIKYWEIGNEIGGNGYYGTSQDWEYDLHYPETNAATRVGQPALSPTAYGSNSVQFITDMKARDHTIQCGVGFSVSNNVYNTPLLQAVGTNADFIIIHWYPGILSALATIPAIVSSSLTELTNVLGAAHASQMSIAVTETGAGTLTGAAVALYTADNYLTWLENGIVNVDYQILHTDFLQNNQTPGHAYYGAVMSHLLANVGDSFLTCTSAQSELRIHATKRQDGKTGIMFVNTDPLLPIAATVTLTNGAALATSGVWYQFGLTNYIGANDNPSYPVSSNNVSGLGNQFTVLVPAYTIVDLLIPPGASNTPPVLAAINNSTVNVGQTVAFTASATDTDQPPQTLTFSLLAGTTNATLNTNSGVFSWRPLVTQGGSTNAFTLKVADNGAPVLSATQSFTVTVNPLVQPGLSSTALSNRLIGFQVSGQAGPDYAVEGSTDLTNWNILFITNSAAMPFFWTDTNTASLPAEFYRVKMGPPLP